MNNKHNNMGWPLTAFLLGITVFAFAVRFYHLDYASFWLDEIVSALMSHPKQSLNEVLAHSSGDVHPPLYQVLLYLWYHLFGYDDFAGRLLSVVIGTLLVPASFALGRVVFSQRVGIALAVIAASNNYLIYYSHEVRSYALLALLSMVSSTLFYALMLRLKRQQHTGLALFGYLLAGAALLNCHFFGFLVIACHALFYLYEMASRPEHLKRYLSVGLIIAATLLIASAHLLIKALTLEGTNFWIDEPSPWFFLLYFAMYFGGIFTPVFAGLIVLALFSLWRKGDHERLRIFLVLIIAPLLIAYIYSVLRTPLLTHRNGIIVVPIALLFAAYGLSLIKSNRWLASVLTLILLLQVVNFQVFGFYESGKQPWRQMSQFIKEEGDTIPLYTFNPAKRYDYYFDQFNVEQRPQQLNAKAIPELSVADFPDTFWLVNGHRLHHDERKALTEKLGYQVIEEFKGHKVLAQLCEIER